MLLPVVVLPGLHQGSKSPRKGPSIHHDWSSRCYSLQMGGSSNLGALLVDKKMAEREEAEQRRLLYVGMTRARDLLVLSGGQTTKPGHDTVLSLLREVMDGEETPSSAEQISIGTSRLTRILTPATVVARRHRQASRSTMGSGPALGPLLLRRQARLVEWEHRRATARRLTPSSLAESRSHSSFPRSVTENDAELSRLVGVCAHAALEQWDFAGPRSEIGRSIGQTIRRYVAQDHPHLITDITEDLEALFEHFLSSDPYRKLQRATLLGREVPFVMSLGEDQRMEGVIDLIYRLDDRIWIADYKTDRVEAEDVPARVESYRSQAESYAKAVASSLGLSSLSFQFIFLRPAISVDLSFDAKP